MTLHCMTANWVQMIKFGPMNKLLVSSASPAERRHRQSSLWTGTVTWCPSSPCWDPVRTGMWGCRERTCAPRTAAGCSGWSQTSFHGTQGRTAALRTRWGGPVWRRAVHVYRLESDAHWPKWTCISGVQQGVKSGGLILIRCGTLAYKTISESTELQYQWSLLCQGIFCSKFIEHTAKILFLYSHWFNYSIGIQEKQGEGEAFFFFLFF